MKLTEAELGEALASFVEKENLEPEAGEIRFETLVDYREGRLDAEEQARIQRALVQDPALAEAFIDLENLDELASLGSQVGDESGRGAGEAKEGAWRRFEDSLPGPGENVGEKKPENLSQPRLAPLAPGPSKLAPLRHLVIRYPIASLAASFLLAASLTVLTWRGPQLGPPLYEQLAALGEAGEYRGASPSEIRIPGETERLILALTAPSLLALPGAQPSEAEAIVRSGGAEVRRQTRLEDEGFYLLELSVAKLDEGPLEIELVDPARGSPLATYRATISKP